MLEVEKSLAKRNGSILNPADASSDRAPYKAVQTGWCIKTPALAMRGLVIAAGRAGKRYLIHRGGASRSFRSLLLSSGSSPRRANRCLVRMHTGQGR
ncbi:hypothetical protein Q31a_34960 [Aureliella helgolandensis]|uniref:Uncharacterized protein n=1 Tax=Aureliella helgolandensis TaxID=2527968 RepID=A0A518G9C2_9BACT|nr:hypothetical protein Q31a_34960 [Aureliella helgolandensis]